jgi:PIN domain nuclease of toxin-antitoxin system
MIFLLDTHIFIWLANETQKLSARTTDIIQYINNVLILSVISVWEIAIKTQLGKLQFTTSLSSVVASQQKINNLQILPVNLLHVLTVESLPLCHKDPFDRLLIAQALTENLLVLSADVIFDQYGIQRIW